MKRTRFPEVLRATKKLGQNLPSRGKTLIDILRSRIQKIERSGGKAIEPNITLDAEIHAELQGYENDPLPSRRERIRLAVGRILGKYLFSGSEIHTTHVQRLLAQVNKRKILI